jgi:hypothetical protein
MHRMLFHAFSSSYSTLSYFLILWDLYPQSNALSMIVCLLYSLTWMSMHTSNTSQVFPVFASVFSCKTHPSLLLLISLNSTNLISLNSNYSWNHAWNLTIIFNSALFPTSNEPSRLANSITQLCLKTFCFFLILIPLK